MIGEKMKLATDPPVSEPQRRAVWIGMDASAYQEGIEAFKAGKKENENPYGGGALQKSSQSNGMLAIEWQMGYRKAKAQSSQGKDENIKAAGVMHITRDGQVLLLKRSKVGDHAGEWGIAGGKVEPGDDSLAATAYREVHEELGEVPPGQGGMKAANRIENGVDFTTFFNLVDQPFIPTLDSEHTAYTWARMDALPANTHPGVLDVVDDLRETGLQAADMEPEDWQGLVGGLLKFISEEAKEPEHAADAYGREFFEGLSNNELIKLYREVKRQANPRDASYLSDAKFRLDMIKIEMRRRGLAMDEACAFDEASARTYDADGRLHVAKTHISKANVCPYYGREIPFFQELGLNPDTIYQLYRHPDELKKAAETFNNLPLLSKHVAVGPDAHPSDLVIGSTGTDAEFGFPYLDNSLVVWTRSGIAAIEEEVQKELSCAYRYRAEMTSGTVDGQHYDGVMRDLVGNHVALVKAGRAGPDVVVGDSALPNLKELFMPSATVLSRKAAVAKGALLVFLRPKLAADAQIDLTTILKDINQSNFGEKKSGILAGLKSAVEGKLAKDASVDDVTELLDALEEAEEAEDETAEDEDDDDDDDKKKAKDKKAKDAKAAKDADKDDEDDKKKAKDAEMKDEDDKKKKAEDKKAMDTAIDTAVDSAVKKAKDDSRLMREAERIVRPYVGDLAIACDSADDVYKIALETLGVDTKGVHPSAFRAILKAQSLPGSTKLPAHAMDSATVKGFNDFYPTANLIKSL